VRGVESVAVMAVAWVPEPARALDPDTAAVMAAEPIASAVA